ncbi:hypothetical protein LINGRAPRIM_LOCUS2614 [Linum grandiflorum]
MASTSKGVSGMLDVNAETRINFGRDEDVYMYMNQPVISNQSVLDGKSNQGTVHIEDEIALAIAEEDVAYMSENNVVDIDNNEVDDYDEGGFCGFDLNKEAKADDEGVNIIDLEAEDRVPINAGEKRIVPANVEEWKKMWFTTVGEAWSFYNDYAHWEGFSSRLRYSNMSRRKHNHINKYMWVLFVCNREGF